MKNSIRAAIILSIYFPLLFLAACAHAQVNGGVTSVGTVHVGDIAVFKSRSQIQNGSGAPLNGQCYVYTGTYPTGTWGPGACVAGGAGTVTSVIAAGGTGITVTDTGLGHCTAVTIFDCTFSITNTAVTAGSFGAANSTLEATVNAQGQLTALSSVAIAIAMSQVSGTLPCGQLPAFTGDVTNSSCAMTIANNAVTAAKIANNTITATQMASGAALNNIGSIANGHLIANASGGSSVPADTAPSTWWDQAFCNTAGYLVARISGTWVCSAAIPANIVWLGADPTGSAASDTAIATACTSAKTVYVPTGTYKMATTATYSACRQWVFDQGGILAPNTGVTITLAGLVHAGVYKIFTALANGSSGTVTGIKSVIPEWWGAVFSTTVDSAPAFVQAANSTFGAVAAASDGGEFLFKMGCGNYFLKGSTTFAPQSNYPIHVKGCGSIGTSASGASTGGTVLLASSTTNGWSGTCVICIIVTASQNADYSASDFEIVNQTQGSGASDGIAIGSFTSNVTLRGFQQTKFENIYISGFAQDWYIQNASLIQFNRVSGWCTDNSNVEYGSCIPFDITALGSSSFTGDLDFYSSQCVGPLGSGTPTSICFNFRNTTGNGTNSGTGIAGIRLHAFDFYGAQFQVQITTVGGSQIHDLWFIDGCQFEGPAHGTNYTEAIQSSINSSGDLISNIHIDHNYFSGSGFGAAVIQLSSPVAGSTISDIFITNNFLSNSGNGYAFIDLRGTTGAGYSVSVQGNEFRAPGGTGNPDVYIENMTHSVASNNIHGYSSSGNNTMTSIVQFNGASGDYIVGIGNNCTGANSTTCVVNSSGVAHALITPNL